MNTILKIVVIIIILVIILFVFNKIFIQQNESYQKLSNNNIDILSKKVEEIVKRDLYDLEIAGALVAITIDDKPLVRLGVGTSLTDVKATPEMHFRIGSITKSFISHILLQLVDLSYLQLGDKLEKWYPNFPFSDQITLEMLANMTSGIPEYSDMKDFDEKYYKDVFKNYSPEYLINISLKKTRKFKPGEDWNYSNTNYIILGRIIEKVLNKPIHEIIYNQITKPLGLKNTFFPINSNMPIPFIHGYVDFEKRWEEATFWNPSWFWTSAQMISNLEDLIKWSKELGESKLLSFTSFKKRFNDKTLHFKKLGNKTFYGIGIIYSNGWIFHDGGVPGYNSICAYLPSKKTSIVIIVNKQTKKYKSNLADIIFVNIIKILYPENVPEFKW